MSTFFKLKTGTVLNVDEIGAIFRDDDKWKIVMRHSTTGVACQNSIIIDLLNQSDYEKICKFLGV